MFGPVIEKEWNPFTSKMIQRSQARVVPIYFPGANSRLYQIANQVSATLRRAYFYMRFHMPWANRNHLWLVIRLNVPRSVTGLTIPVALCLGCAQKRLNLVGRVRANLAKLDIDLAIQLWVKSIP